MSEPLKRHFFISSYEPTLEEAEEQFNYDVNDATLDCGKWQLWHIQETKEHMNYIITFTQSTRKFRESIKEVYLELIKEVETTFVTDSTEKAK